MSESEIKITSRKVLSNNEIMEKFKCGCEGGIRKSKTTKTVVLVNNRIKNIYPNVWQNGILYFSGAERSGDQVIDKGLNKSLLSAFENDWPVYLFEVSEPKKYTFLGRVELFEEPFQKKEKDISGMQRNVWKFPLKLKEDE